MKELDYIIQAEHITKSFGEKTVLNDVSLNVKRGEFVTILGSSGCGKTTMLRILAGFETPTSGKIRMNGHDITTMPPYRRPMNTVRPNAETEPMPFLPDQPPAAQQTP